MNRMVEVFTAFDALVLLMVKSLAVPVALTLPSRVTYSAPFRSISGEAAISPSIERPVTVG